MKTAGRKGLCDFIDMLLPVGFHGDLEHDLFEAVGYLCLVVIELDDVGVLLGEYLRDLQQLSGLVRKLYGEAEYTAAGDEGLVDEGGDRRYIDVAAADDGSDLLSLEIELRKGCQ